MASILIIDDDDMMRQMVREMLERSGHQVREAYLGDTGVEYFELDRSDLVITDLFMPPKGGLEVIKELKAIVPEVKIIAITGVDVSGTGYRHDIDPKQLAMAAGACRTFKKPFGQEEFMAAVEEILAA
jgi:CheY-like chemotaxis protein